LRPPPSLIVSLFFFLFQIRPSSSVEYGSRFLVFLSFFFLSIELLLYFFLFGWRVFDEIYTFLSFLLSPPISQTPFPPLPFSTKDLSFFSSLSLPKQPWPPRHPPLNLQAGQKDGAPRASRPSGPFPSALTHEKACSFFLTGALRRCAAVLFFPLSFSSLFGAASSRAVRCVLPSSFSSPVCLFLSPSWDNQGSSFYPFLATSRPPRLFFSS